MFRKPLPWILLLLFCLGATVYTWHAFPKAFSLVNVELTANRSTALDSARARAERFKLGPEGFRQAAAFRTDNEVKTFVELEGGGTSALQGMIDGGRYQPYKWVVRHFQEQEPRETELRFTPDGRPYGFTEDWPEDADGPGLSADSARTIAENEATAHWNVRLGKYELVSSSQEERPNGRVDHTFVYERPNLTIGEGQYRLRLGVSGASLSEVTHFVKVPEAFSRRYEEMRSANTTINQVGFAAALLLYILGGCGFGLYWLLRKRALKWRMAVVWGSVLATLQLLVGLNRLPLSWLHYDTALAAQSFLLQQVVFSLMSGIGIGLLATVAFIAAEGLSRMAFGHHPRLWRLWNPNAAGTTTVLGQTVAGYLLVALFFAYQIALYVFAQDALGWWTPANLLFDPNILAQYAPWLPPVANALQAGFLEEALFRAIPLAGAALIGRRLGGRRWWIGGALLLQAVIFGAGHAGYASQPAYARLVELILPAIGFGLLYLSYGLLPPVVLHFVFDAVWLSLPLFVSDAAGIWWSRGMVILLALIPLLVVFYGRLRRGQWTALPAPFYNRTWTPETDERPEETSIPVRPGLSWQTSAAVGVAGLLGLGLWIGSTSFSTFETPLSTSRSDAETQARRVLDAHGVDPDAWSMVSAVQVPKNADDEFIWQEGGSNVYKELMGRYLDGPFWQVRFRTFEGSVEARAEEYRVHLAPLADRIEVVHTLPEAAPGDSLDEATARSLADSVVHARYEHIPGELRRIGAEPTARPNRRDWTFTYADTSGYPLDRGEARITVEFSGSEVTDASTFIHTPESWERQSRRRDTTMQIIGLVAGVVMVLLALCGVVGGLVYWARGHFHVWSFLLVTGSVFSVAVVGTANAWPETVAGFSTAQPYIHQVVLALIGPLLLWTCASGGLGLIAGFTHDRIGGTAGTPLPQSTMTGLGLGFLGTGLLSVLEAAFPSLSPPWAAYDALDAALPYLDPIHSRLLSFVRLTVILLLVAVSVHRWTRAGTNQRPVALLSLLGLGFVVAGMGSVGTLGMWAVHGLTIGLLLVGTQVLIWPFDRAVIPMIAAGIVLPPGIKVMVTAPTTSIFIGELVGSLIIIASGVVWARLLKERQITADTSVT